MTGAYLVLEDGSVFAGTAWGSTGLVTGELAISTRMTGYQSVLTDPAHTGNIVMMTAPHIGNVGVNSETSTRFTAAGVIVREPARRASNWKCEGSLEQALADQKVIGISGVDTRAVTVHVRQRGTTMRCAIVSGTALPPAVSATQTDTTAAVIQVAAAAILSAQAQPTTGEDSH